MRRIRSLFGVLSVISLGVLAFSCSNGGGGSSTGTVGTGTPSLSLSPASGAVGTLVLIVGEDFNLTVIENQIEFPGGVSALAEVATQTTLLTRVPSGAKSGPIKITANGKVSFTPTFLVLPLVTSVSPTKAPVNTILSITGSGFDTENIANNTVTVNGLSAPVTDATATFLNALVPVGATSGPLLVHVGGLQAAGPGLASPLIVPPSITEFSPEEGLPGDSVSIQGFGFASAPGDNDVRINGTPATVVSSSYFVIEAIVSPGTSTGPITVTVNGETGTSATDFVLDLPPQITNFTPDHGIKGSVVSIQGVNFNSNPTKNQVSFGSFPAVVFTASSSSLQVIVPQAIPDQTPPQFISVTTTGGTAISATTFEIDYPPIITDFFPKSGTQGTPITIIGENFFPTPGENFVEIGGVPVTVVDASVSTLVVYASESVSGLLRVSTEDGEDFSSDFFQTVVSRFAYVANTNDQTVSNYVLEDSNATLRHNGFLFLGNNKGPKAPAAHPSQPYLYVPHSTAAEVAQYRILADGTLEALGAPTVGSVAGPQAMVVHPSGNFAYVLCQGSANPVVPPSISQYTISSGSLSAHATPQIPVGGTAIRAIAIDSTGKFVYATSMSSDNSASVVMFSVGVDGGLSSMGSVPAGSSFVGAVGITGIFLHPNGKFAYVGNESTNVAYVYSISNGVLSPILDGLGAPISFATGGNGPTAFAMDLELKYLYVGNKAANNVGILQADASTGLLTLIGSLPLPSTGASAASPVQLALLDGNLVSVNNLSHEIVSMSIDESDGQLTIESQVRGRNGPSGIAFSTGASKPKISTRSVIVANAFSTAVGVSTGETFTLDEQTGALTSTGALPTGTAEPAVWVGVHPFGRFCYIALRAATVPAGGGPATFSVGTLDTASGALSGFTGPWAITPPPEYTAKAFEFDRSGRFVHGILEKLGVDPTTVHMAWFTIDQTTGDPATGVTINNNLAPQAGKAQSLAPDPSGRFLFVASPGTNNAQSLSINANTGALTSSGTAGIGAESFPYAVATHPSGRFVYVAFGKGTSATLVDSIRPFVIGTTGGFTALTTVAIGETPYTTSGSSVKIDALGRFLFLILNDGRIQTWPINKATGELGTPIVNSIAGIVGNTPHSLDVDASGNYLFVANSGDTPTGNNIVTCSIAANGSLTLASATLGIAGDRPQHVSVNRAVQ